MTVERSMGKTRPRTPRPGSSPLTTALVTSVPIRDPKSGKFVPGNRASVLRRLKAAHKLGFVGLVPDKVIAWLKPFVVLARTDAARLIEELSVADSPSLVGLVEDTASARAFLRGLLALAATGDKEAEEKALRWMREVRQNTITLRAESREHRKNRPAFPTIDDREAQRRLDARLKAREQETVEEDPDEGETRSEGM